jgi:FKBP-type peptidyl-prolyl cis-trans isomerase 2
MEEGFGPKDQGKIEEVRTKKFSQDPEDKVIFLH